jgi:hypothetical protein
MWQTPSLKKDAVCRNVAGARLLNDENTLLKSHDVILSAAKNLAVLEQ